MRRPAFAVLATLAAAAGLLVLRPPPVDAQTGKANVAGDGGEELFLEGCASCHGADGRGVTDPSGDVRGPSLEGAGEALTYYQVSTGRMPLANTEEVPVRKPPAYDPAEIEALVAYVATLGDGPALPELPPGPGDLSMGGDLYRGNCAPCHSAAGVGGALSYGRAAPTVRPADALEIAAAIRSGPNQMPRFGEDVLSDQEVADIIRYVTELGRHDDEGGLSLGGVGPVAEGFVIWVFGMTAVVAAAYWIGRKGHPS